MSNSLPPRVRQNHWDLDAVLPLTYKMSPCQIDRVPAEVVANFRRLLSRDVYSEGDAQSLYDHIVTRSAEMSPAFLAMLDLWLADELKHYAALRRVYHCLTGTSYSDMNRQFVARVHEIAPIAPLLVDEFTILVTMMFDEIGSVYSYRRDLWEYYRHFGTNIHNIGHHLVKDEGMHFTNAAELLLAQHQHRFSEIPELLARIVALEQSLQRYHQTFLLDHAQEQYRFPPQFNSVLSQLILSRLQLGQRPDRSALLALWQWVPAGQQLVPIG